MVGYENTMNTLNGKVLQQEIFSSLKERLQVLKDAGVTPTLVTILIGNNAPSKLYIERKILACKDLGMVGILEERTTNTSEQELLALIEHYNAKPDVHGILIQKPFPLHINELAILSAISPYKDVDGFHPENVGLLVSGNPCFVPCTPLACMYMLKSTGVELKGKHVVVIGRSDLVGKPLAMMLINASATVTVCNSTTKDLRSFTKQADIVIVAIGKPKLITKEYIKKGAIVLDVGISRDTLGKISGDVDFESVSLITKNISPVPGGVGPITIAMLLQNTVLAAELQNQPQK